MKATNKKEGLKKISKKMPYGAKQEIANSIGEPQANVQTAFRGMAGKELTGKVWKKAQKYLPTQMKVRKMVAAR